ncbi:hypothetical protein BDA99DRAFT_512488 [Phascolomyces articulosus]|uniref:Uncharacterized protein n=1 Tax=Phascolomyces articulosus TaxID=60185 RepID=A0AAD5JYH6_9FUNG|nr:hypothetical protein BDA99DRAFT_512488 [Phascolomyces articulosus]
MIIKNDQQLSTLSETKESMTDISNCSIIVEQEQENQEQNMKQDNNKKDDTLDIEAMAAAITAAVQSGGRGTSSMALGNASIIPNRGRSQSESTRSTTNNRRSSSSNRQPSFFLPNSNNNRIIPQDAMAPRPKRSSSMSSQHSLPPLIKSSSSTSTSRSRSSSTSTSRHYSARFSWLVGPSGMANDQQQEQQQQQHRGVGQEPTIMEENSEPSVDDGRRELMYRGIQVKEIKTTLKTMVIPHEVENPMPKVELQRPGFARINY